MNAKEIIDTIAAETSDLKSILEVLEDGQALAAMNITDDDQDAVEEAHAEILERIASEGSAIFGRENDDGTIAVLYADTGEAVTRLPESMPMVWPVGSDLSSKHEHPDGIILSMDDAEKIGLEVEANEA